jgi:cyanophycinase
MLAPMTPPSARILTPLRALGACAGLAACFAGLAAAAATSPTGAAPVTVPEGYVVPIGGALEYGNDEVWSRLVQLSGGRGTRWVVLATAAGNPEASAAAIVGTLRRHGAAAEALPMAPRLAGTDAVAEARNPLWVERVDGARGVYFAGGDQARIVDTLLPGGEPTPLLVAIRDLLARGGVVAGSSAGAAIMSATMFRDATDVMSVMRGTLRAGVEVDRGLGFAGPALFVDQHFLRRGRIGRMLPLMVAKGYRLGLGVDEDTAAIIHRDTVEVVGRRGVLLVDLSDVRAGPAGGAFALAGARLSYLERGDRVDLRTLEPTPAPAKLAGGPIDPAAREFEPYHGERPFFGDILADSALVGAMIHVVDGESAEVRGLAFERRADLPPALAPLGFEFRLYRGEGTRGWYTGAFGNEAYTLAGVLLDVTPVRVTLPPYRPWSE